MSGKSLLVASWLVWLSAAAVAQPYALRQYSAIDGLPQSQVNAIVEDDNGYLWIGTQGGGLARFDGKEFKTYNTGDGLLSNIITSLMLDRNQNLWVVHPQGISRFDGVAFKTFSSPETSPRRIRRLYELGDSLIFSIQGGMFGKIENDSIGYWEKTLPGNKLIFSGIRLPNQQAFFYLNDSSFLKIDSLGKRDVITHRGVFDRVLGLFHDTGNLVVETDKGYFSLNYAQQFQRVSFPFPNHVVAFDPLSKFYWSFNNNTLTRQRSDGTDKADVLTEVMVTQLHFDKEGNVWIGTNGRGLYKYTVLDFEQIVPQLDAVMAIAKDKKGVLWIGSGDKGLWKMEDGIAKKYPFKIEAGITDIKFNATGELWIASSLGLARYDSLKDTFQFFNRADGLSSQYIANVEPDDDGGVWCGTVGAGLNYWNGQATQITAQQGLNGQIVYAIRYHKPDNALYVGTEAGLNKVLNKKPTAIALPELKNTSVYSINPYQEYLLVGSSGAGVVLFDPTTAKAKKTFTTKEGLPSNLIYFAVTDQDHYIWVGTERGVNRLWLNNDFEIVENIHFGYENGLTGVETNQNAFYIDDEKYFGLIDGLYRYNPNENLPVRSQALHLTNVELFYGEYPVYTYADSTSGFFKTPYQPVFPSDKNHLTFSFNRVDKRNPSAVHYKYFLENFDMTWSQPTSQSSITYGNLPPGKYTLHVLATNKKGSWDVDGLAYTFSIRAPFYATSSFITFVAVALVALVLFIMSWRVRSRTKRVLEIERIRQQEQEQLRKEIARDFHDEMGNQLTRIINYISLMKLSQNGHAKELYNKVEESAKYLYAGTRDFIWSIDPLNDELSRLFLHIRDFGEKLFEEKEIQFRAYNELKEVIRVPYGFSREANLIIKEAMTNVFNHSEARNVSFSLRRVGDKFEMVLEDDGKGFLVEEVGRLNGIRNMRIRAERIKAELRIQQITPGTRVALAFEKFKSTSKKYVNTI